MPPSPPTESVVGGWGVTGAVVSLFGSIAIAMILRQPMFALIGAVGVDRGVGRGGHRTGARGARSPSDPPSRRRGVHAVRRRVGRNRCRPATTRRRRSDRPMVPASALRRRPGSGRGDAPTATRFGSWPVGARPGARSRSESTSERSARNCGPVVDAATLLRDVPVGDRPRVRCRRRRSRSSVSMPRPSPDRSSCSLRCSAALPTGGSWWSPTTSRAMPGPSGSRTRHPDTTTKAVIDHDDSRALTEAFDRLVEDAPRVVVLTDVPATLATRTSPLRRFLASDRPVTTIVTIDRGGAVPAFCRSVLEVGTRARARWHHPADASVGSDRLHVAGLATETALPDRAVPRRVLRPGGSRRCGIRADHRRPDRGPAGRATHRGRDRRVMAVGW